ncbi:MAG TPA: NfeD family protein [Thermoclostridium caenicola]|uniref:Membrane protein implicated in regulation of membrane protease activity n=1 Tax=Thermoclostridium caenicola TaxID=659425 RepID=A0A1M6JJP5_9FIRM|nr:NfeD family protein [Thermoclostridium caenicola]SHJ46900.1 Membrane protein implicated in regulation of membrane protease activity [Thermoclostridium caenicola]HOK42354.1 NfeD family protein [Thermoclostridium caenicola]HOL84631.1 NfeD family protein [Thermoclostridium caenicola]HOP71831.1 NfeD family protein [Thermoclostridium caenicola]HPO76451.1 NfeD family protein [Thermoclostridium caenicola]
MEGTPIYVWLGLIIVLTIIEAATVSLTTIWFAAGSLLAFFVALLGLPLGVQIAVFLVSSTLLIIFTRPIALKYLKVGRERTNVESLIGETGLVVTDIVPHSTGQVKVKGQIWTAVSKNGEPIRKDSEVIIDSIEGVKLIVVHKNP